MKKWIITSLFAASIPLAAQAQEPLDYKVELKEPQHRSQFSLRYFYASNSIDQWFKGDNVDSFTNTKLSLGLLNLNADYWFGILTPGGLGDLGSIFGLGISLDYGDYLIQNVRLLNYILDLRFAQLSLLHSDDWSSDLSLSLHYTSYYNSIYDSLVLTEAAPFSGVGASLRGKHPIFNIGEAEYRLGYIPSARTPSPLPDGYGLMADINTRWFLQPSLAMTVGYRFNYFLTSGATQAQNADTGEALSINRTLQDMFHGLSVGFTHYF